MRQFAAGRPDEQDKKVLAEFAVTIRSRMETGSMSAPLKTAREPSLQRIRRRSHEKRRPVKPVPDVDFARKRVRSKRSILPIRQRPIRKAVFPVCGALPYARRRQGASAVCCLQPAA